MATQLGIHKKKEALLSLEKYAKKKVVVECYGRLIQGVLRGFDSNLNLVLNDAIEADSHSVGTHEVLRSTEFDKGVRRFLGAIVIRGNAVMSVCPLDGAEVVKDAYQ